MNEWIKGIMSEPHAWDLQSAVVPFVELPSVPHVDPRLPARLQRQVARNRRSLEHGAEHDVEPSRSQQDRVMPEQGVRSRRRAQIAATTATERGKHVMCEYHALITEAEAFGEPKTRRL